VVTEYYNSNTAALAASYESLQAARLNDWFVDALPAAPACVLDVGAGSGRDAAWLASLGFDVVAVEPSVSMVREARRLHDNVSIHWVEGDALPGLDRTLRRGQAFDFILLSAVWMHLPPTDRPRAFRKLVSLLKPGGRMALSLRHGPPNEGQQIYDVTLAEIECLCRAHGAYVERAHEFVADLSGRSQITWTQVLVRLPDDGSGALPLLRQIILNDSKETTYKLALLRTLCRIADSAAGYARPIGDDQIAVPLGLVALYWLRLFKPLLQAGLPQSADNQGLSKLGFVKDAYCRLMPLSHLDLRIGMAGFGPDTAPALHQALRDAIATISTMPARYITYGDGSVVFAVHRKRSGPVPGALRLDEVYLSSFGYLQVPAMLWSALQRYAVWIEPSIEAEWTRLMHGFAARQGRSLDLAAVTLAMTWPDHNRDVRDARERALKLILTGDLHCVWSGKRLQADTLAMDHCLPFAVWSCDDLWNLLPSDSKVNGRKGQRLPSMQQLRERQTVIQEWWQRGYCAADQPALRQRFETEARATLPTIGEAALTTDEVFSGLLLQHLRLRSNQQAPVWKGEA
jgi:SAM-dependent methyltransferase